MVSFLLIQVPERNWIAGILCLLLHAQRFRCHSVLEFLLAKLLRYVCAKYILLNYFIIELKVVTYYYCTFCDLQFYFRYE